MPRNRGAAEPWCRGTLVPPGGAKGDVIFFQFSKVSAFFYTGVPPNTQITEEGYRETKKVENHC